MDPNDAVIQHELEMCSTQAQVVICEAGGISKFLRQSLQFAVVDGYICLTTDAPKARQLARSRRQQQPQVKLNPPQYMATPAASVSAFVPNTLSSTPFVAKMHPQSTYRSLAGVDISSPPPSRIVPGLSPQSDFPPPNMPAFLSQPTAAPRVFQPDIDSSVDVQTAVHHTNTSSDNGLRRINANSTYDSWTTVSKPSKSSGGIRNPGNISSGAIGELDDFSEESCMIENSSSVGELTLNNAAANDVTKQNMNYEQFKNMHKTLESDSSDESSDDDSLSDGGSVDEEVTECDATVISEAAETSATHVESTSVTLSATAPEFVPLSYAANRPSLVTSVGTSSPKPTVSSQSDSRPGSVAAASMSDKQVQTDEGWSPGELQQLKDAHGLELAQLHQQLSLYQTQLQVCLSVSRTALCGCPNKRERCV